MKAAPIYDHGMVGNMRTCALIDKSGNVDWMCFPHFDSPSVFGGLLDGKKGGWFHLAPRSKEATAKQMYWPDTNVLITRHFDENGACETVDFMPVRSGAEKSRTSELIRIVNAVRGKVSMRVDCRPAFDYARRTHRTRRSPSGVVFQAGKETMELQSSVKLKMTKQAASGTFMLRQGESAVFRFGKPSGKSRRGVTFKKANYLLEQTVEYWHRWLSQCTYRGRWRDEVHRSALLLKLLTFEPTGAIIAAPTTSLPENPGGERNWDYRYTWIRDSAFTIYALLKIGFTTEAERYVDFLRRQFRKGDTKRNEPLQLMLGIDGRRRLPEETLSHLGGYLDSKPVRNGNEAYSQFQLDIYGELIDSIYLYDKHATPIGLKTWQMVTALADWVVLNWNRKDVGIWEVRSSPRHFLHSKLMCWVALDRALRLAERRSLPADTLSWKRCRDSIYREILQRGFHRGRQSFVHAFDDDRLDASALMIPLVRFLSPVDSKMLSTFDAILKPPDQGGLTSAHLVHRYNSNNMSDGLRGGEGTFNLCTFWLVEGLTRAGRYRPKYLSKARQIFERMLGFSSPLGLFSEQTGRRGEALGNYPQGLTHLALISAAYQLDQALDGRRPT